MMLDSETMEILKDMEQRYAEAAMILDGLEDDRFAKRAEALRLVREKLLLPDWNAVKEDGNPDCRGIYLTILEGGEYRILAYQNYGDGLFWYDDDPEQDYVRVDIVTHWMPLPEPPEEGKR